MVNTAKSGMDELQEPSWIPKVQREGLHVSIEHRALFILRSAMPPSITPLQLLSPSAGSNVGAHATQALLLRIAFHLNMTPRGRTKLSFLQPFTRPRPTLATPCAPTLEDLELSFEDFSQ